MTKNRAVLSGLTLLFIVRLLAMIWVPLTDPTEARYAEIARKMVETGNWITPQFDYGVPFWAKPPLHTWLSAVGVAVFGATPFAARLGIMLATITTLIILWRWARTLTDQRTAAASILVAASSGLFFVSAAFVQTDMVLTLGVTASMAGFYNGLQGSRRWGWLFFLGLAIGLLAKGPVAVVLSMTPITVWMLWRGHWRDLVRLPWAGGLALCAVLVIPWYAAAEAATPGFLYYFLIGEHIERFLQPGWSGDLYGAGREHAKGTIWLFWIVATLPWSPLLPVLVWRLRGRAMPEDKGLLLYLLLFALTPLVFFTFAANILLAYVLPGIPAAALLAVMLWTQTGPTGVGWLRLGVAEVLLIFASITAGSFLGLDRPFMPTEATLVESHPGAGRLAILGARSFSAEFYTKGKIVRLQTLTDLVAWLAPGDRVLIPKYEYTAFIRQFGNAIKPISEDRQYMLFIPIPAATAAN
ncbi:MULTISPECIES: glycosyltransferase family 39 protein [unclassified Rhizobium]|jgi:4-amino-4-deoxy-L-arabinose transferase-like glycosyltransferase|uniref:ArnT family glycosyltransferase n=1 Tax=unclassified Rhizobium TaxID=2613769 RepID=UPI000645CBB7|nr:MULTISPECIES: glycosyltransferase family 39 protein [unclassified Rhizobium]OJY74502.1 MAG: dolichyl-phosphate-mannose--protein mannosyltransferase [Rhizobium sp. 60-20]RKD67885.1 4-amino-4-deoxy-L-arabinose transferase-like glycosyltransferase [Rhizobium sp. WW_1]